MPADPAWDEGSLAGLQMAVFLLCPHVAEREILSCVFSNRGTDPVHEGPTLTA